MSTVIFRNREKNSVPIAEQVKRDEVKEYWVQRYISANYKQLGFEGMEGPFDSGPDFRMLKNGKWVLVEAEVVYENYLSHKHHENPKWASCAILIVLGERKPGKKTKKLLPKTILHIDKAHFKEWYRTAARDFAIDRQKREAEGEVFGISYSNDDASLEGQSMPGVCPECHKKSPLVFMQADIEEMTEGQLADYWAGNWGYASCPLCQSVVFWNS